jgi:hypothetical protein
MSLPRNKTSTESGPDRTMTFFCFTMGCLREITVHDRTPGTDQPDEKKISVEVCFFYRDLGTHGDRDGGTSLFQLTDVPAEK